MTNNYPMKKFSFFFILVLISTNIFAQATIKKVIHTHARYREEVEVLKSNPEVLHGQYKCHVMVGFDGGKAYVTGYYENGRKTGLWEEYGSRGHYKNGRKVGEWRYVDKEGRLCQIYDHTKRQFVLKTEGSQPFKNGQLLDGSPIESSSFIGGSYYHMSLCARYWSFTKEAIDANAQGRVVARLYIDETGEVINYKIIETPGYGLEESFKNVFEKILKTDIYFDPPRVNGKPKACSLATDINFNIKQ
ncbi:MAG: hypothetical protein EAZ57_06740 [Cytophagales bacterium]|nr:MAG: hypothetical protein EAZ67_07795 [Cytophagales bacterium]TAF60556.1 MAG: hypothetical protein EAZ57_06740 [Cytophagales bacterium]